MKVADKVVEGHAIVIANGFIHAQNFIQKYNGPIIVVVMGIPPWQAGAPQQVLGLFRTMTFDKATNPGTNVVIRIVGILGLERPTFFGAFSTTTRIVAKRIG
jgi:hypothetical protein